MYRDDPPQWPPSHLPQRSSRRSAGKLSGAQRAVIVGALAVIAVLVVTFVVVLVSSPNTDTGTSSLAVSFQVTATSKAKAKHTPTRTPSGIVTATPAQSAPVSPALLANTSHFTQDQIPHVVQIGDLAFSQMELAPLTYPGVMLPANLPLTKPYQVSTNLNPFYHSTSYVAANPSNTSSGFFTGSP